MTPRSRQRGVALLIAMLAVTVGTIIAVNLMWQGTLDLRRAESALASDQGMLYMQGAEAWAADILRQDEVDSPQSDNLGEIWATELPPLPVDGGTIQGKLEDLQGRFNLNSLIDNRGRPDPIALKQFERLLSLLEIDPQLAGGVLDWLDPDTEVRFPNGGEDSTYAAATPPYRTANMPITSPSELMAVTGFDPSALRDGFARRDETERQHGDPRHHRLALRYDRRVHREGHGRGARKPRVPRHQGHIPECRRQGHVETHRRHERALLVDRHRDARYKSNGHALRTAARPQRYHARFVP